MKRQIEMGALAFAALVAMPSHAQDRTPEGALQFLQTALQDVEVDNFDGMHGRYREFAKPEAGGCTLKARLDFLDDSRKPTGSGGWLTQDFTRTMEVKLLGDSVREIHKDGDKAVVFSFEFGSKAMAERVVTAMEFLRKHCDKAAGTGF